MNEAIRHALRLPQGNLLRIDEGKGLLVSVTRGEVWLTEEGELRDIVLRGGDSFRLERDGRSLIYAFEPAELALSAPRSREYPEPPAVFSLVPAARPA